MRKKNSLFLQGIKIERDRNPSEMPPFIWRVFHPLVATFLSWLPPRIAQALFLAGGDENSDRHVVARNPTTYIALETIYTFPIRYTAGKTSFPDNLWERYLYNAIDVRNRLRLVEQELQHLILLIAKQSIPVRVISVGCGSARAVIESVASLKDRVRIDLTLIDISRDALNFAKTLASQFGVNPLTYRDFAQNIAKYSLNGRPHIVEMVGLLDYLANKWAVSLVNEILKTLIPGGYLLTCNIVPNLEQGFVTKGIRWKMIYRRPEQLAQLLIEAGFSPSNIRLILTPLRIHCLAICQKPEEVA
jgi:SAM-dependent methyltransferase